MDARLALALSTAALSLCACPRADDDEAKASAPTSESSTSASGSSSEASSEASSTAPETETGETGTEDPRPARLVMTSDWRAKRLSLLDYELLRDGADRDGALWKTIELDDWEPGPLEAELGPDGRTALVAIAPGFFAGPVGGLVGAGEVPEGGALLVVDIETDAVLASFETAQYPMGVAFRDDGSAGWSANFGGNGQAGVTLSHVDLDDLTLVEEVEIGPGPEQLDIRAELAIVNTAGDGAVRLFELGDPLGTASPPLVVSSDPSWVLFVGPGQDRAVAVNSVGPPGYTLLDISDPMAPAALDTVEVVGIPYAAARAGSEGEIVMSTLAGTELNVARYDTAAGELIDEYVVPAVGFPLGIAYAPDDELALVPIPGEDVLALVDFGLGEVRIVDWQAEPGPTYVSLE